MRCRHVPEWMQAWPGGPLSVYQCIECMRDLPYPPASDAPADEATARAMRVEQRAAEIAADWDATMDLRGLELTPMESLGACSPESQHLDLPYTLLDDPHERDRYLAGHLAQVIATHGEP